MVVILLRINTISNYVSHPCCPDIDVNVTVRDRLHLLLNSLDHAPLSAGHFEHIQWKKYCNFNIAL